MRRSAGLSLVEVLFAILVLGIGLGGVVALFPWTIEAGKEAVDRENFSLLASSVRASIQRACREARWDPRAGRYRIVLRHDLRDGRSEDGVELELPGLREGWRRFPGGRAADPSVEDGEAFRTGRDEWIRKNLDWVSGTGAFAREEGDWGDASDPAGQFWVVIDASKVDPWKGADPPPEAEQWAGLYEFRVYILRGPRPESKQLVDVLGFQCVVR